MNSLFHYSAIFDCNSEFVKLLLVAFLQLHFEEGRLVFIDWQDQIIPFVSQLFQLCSMCVLKRCHFFFLPQKVKLAKYQTSASLKDLHAFQRSLPFFCSLRECGAPSSVCELGVPGRAFLRAHSFFCVRSALEGSPQTRSEMVRGLSLSTHISWRLHLRVRLLHYLIHHLNWLLLGLIKLVLRHHV